MNYPHIKLQSTRDKEWIDETGSSIPYNRTTASERLREKKAYNIASRAIALNNLLTEFKKFVQDACDDVVTAIRKDAKVKTDSKGNFTWYNFNRSIKIEVNVNEAIQFDETLIEAAKEILNNVFDKNLKGDEFVKGIATEAFQTSNGRLDTKRVLGLKKHTNRIANADIKKEWSKAMELIAQAVNRPKSKSYFRIWLLDEHGEYINVDMNFSNIKA